MMAICAQPLIQSPCRTSSCTDAFVSLQGHGRVHASRRDSRGKTVTSYDVKAYGWPPSSLKADLSTLHVLSCRNVATAIWQMWGDRYAHIG
jgi:hypothetical protein